VAKYFDKRERREKSIPDCERHGLVWNPVSQRCEKITVLGFLMAEDFYIDDYGGDFYDAYAPIDYAPEFELLPQQETQVFDLQSFDFFGLPYEGFEPLPDLPIFEQEPFLSYLPFEPGPTLEPLPPIDLFAETIQMETEPGGLIQTPVELPTLTPFPTIPYITPYVPIDFEGFPEGPFYGLPEPPKLGPCDTPNGLPGPCARGFYHPQADPCSCVPFPPAPTQTSTQQPTTTAPKSSSPTPSPTSAPVQQQQACPTGYCKHPTTGQCMQIPVGYVRHPQTQICTLATQQTAPPGETDVFAELKKLPWWVWAGIAGVFVLSQGGGRR
jgi:hypothetical protein